LDKHTTQADEVIIPIFHPHDFEQRPGNLDVVKEKLAFDVGSRGRRKNWRETYIDQSE
jgi:hypothetical protein